MAFLKRSSYWQNVHPVGAISDFIAVWRQAGSGRWWIALAAAITTLLVFSIIWNEGDIGPPPRPEVTYITTFAPDRSDTEIMASNLANQKLQDKLAADQAKRDEMAKDMYRTLGRAIGMDVEAIEKEAAEEKAAATPARRLKTDDAAGRK